MTHLRPEIDGLSNSTDRKTIEYYQCLADLPWRSGEAETVDVQCAQRLLDDGHFGLAGPKTRILEYLAVRHRTRDARGAVLCFVGPRVWARRRWPRALPRCSAASSRKSRATA